ncbi:N-acetyltransferase [Sphaerisporangium siamense]|uniref:Putative GNAT family acetyltransferase n=1 Tax=Sphaerisporangium siamense TaxID=795645 RepID=A0A7W7D5S4_9ACTN|nr:GNAT family N-acetyltransferase [Sphaerisporangium siamense]MBB4700829.1 putative GNAT family acetyltransferase [Sphaerisporangium siamense]GII86025.1 N-acetyltransferase [Sphaerisporangium siamense]
MEHAVDVADNPEARRYEIRVDGKQAGFADYRLRDDRMVFTHTEIDEEYEGQGLGGTLIRVALDAARDTGLRVVPLCPFVAAYIEKHPEYADLVAEAPPESEPAR